MQESRNAQLLHEWPWESLAKESDRFALYQKRQQLEKIFISGSDNLDTRVSLNWINTSVDKLVSCNDSLLSRSGQMYLELFHLLLKRYRKYLVDHEDDLQTHPGHILLLALENHKATGEWIRTGVTCSNNGVDLVPFLVCMVDVVKIYTIMLEKEMMDNVSESLMIRTLRKWLDKLSSLWWSPHITVVRRSLELSLRLLRLQGDMKKVLVILTSLLSFAETLRQSLDYTSVNDLFRTDRTEFFYSPVSQEIALDRECLKQLMQIILMTLEQLISANVETETTADKEMYDHVNSKLMQLLKLVQLYRQELAPLEVLRIVFELYGNNDEDAVNLQLTILRMWTAIPNRNSVNQSLITTVKTLLSSLELEPHRLFVYFCYRACMDYSLLVDFLLSNETDFLLFFLQYLRYVEKDPESLKKTCSSFEQENDGISLGNIANMLQRLVFVLKGGGFPYNPSSLVKRINSVLRSIQ